MAPRKPPRGYATWSAYNRYRAKRGRERGLSPAQARGHPGRDEKLASEVERDVTVVGPQGATATRIVGVQQLSVAGGADNAVQELLAGKLDPATFNRRWAGRTFGGQVVPDAARVLALARSGLVGFSDFYPDRSMT